MESDCVDCEEATEFTSNVLLGCLCRNTEFHWRSVRSCFFLPFSISVPPLSGLFNPHCFHWRHTKTDRVWFYIQTDIRSGRTQNQVVLTDWLTDSPPVVTLLWNFSSAVLYPEGLMQQAPVKLSCIGSKLQGVISQDATDVTACSLTSYNLHKVTQFK